MRKVEMAAVVFITLKPLEAFVRGRWEPGFRFLPVQAGDAVDRLKACSQFEGMKQ